MTLFDLLEVSSAKLQQHMFVMYKGRKYGLFYIRECWLDKEVKDVTYKINSTTEKVEIIVTLRDRLSD